MIVRELGMSQSEGSEGDEIILLAFRSLDCRSFNDDVKRISELKPEHLLEIISKSIRLIRYSLITYLHLLVHSLTRLFTLVILKLN